MKYANYFLLLLPALYPLTAHSAQLGLSDKPLFLGTNVPPNVFFQLDDSGSMDWEFNLSPYWEACAYDPNITGVYSAITSCGSHSAGDDGLRSYGNLAFRNFNYIFNNSDNIYNNLNPGGCSSSWIINAVEACPQAGTADWRAFSPSMNRIFYNPDIKYQPWLYNCEGSTPCGDANFATARSYPVQGTSSYNLLRNLSGIKYDVWVDNKGFSGSRPLRGLAVNVNSTPNGDVDIWDSHVTVVVTTTDAKIYSTTYAPTALGLNATTTLQATLTDMNLCYNALGSQELVRQIFNGQLAYTSTDEDGCMSISDAQTNIANWYSYNRRRSLAARGAVAYVINQYPNFRFGFNTINNAFFKEVPPLAATSYASYNDNILDTLMLMSWQQEGTPLRSGLDRVGKYFSNQLSGKANPVTESCQQNYTILITDGYWNDSDSSVSSVIGDVDQDGYSKTLADVAYYYYKTDLSGTLPNIISPSIFDSATWQHMVTYTMGLGLTGNLVAGPDGWPTPALGINSNWGNPYADDAAKVDDLWHAAFNSRGFFFDLKNPSLGGSALDSVLSNIAIRNTSNASAAQNSTILKLNSAIYQAILNPSNWQGDLLAYGISLGGVLASTPTWSAQCVLTGGTCFSPAGTFPGISYTNRVIITRNWTGANNGIAFRWPTSYTTYKSGSTWPTNLKNFLASAPFSIDSTSGSRITSNNNYGKALLEYIRGRRSQEKQFGGSFQFRDRGGIMGDVVDSNPIYVPAPYRYYNDTFEAASYSAFKTTYANRTPIVYVGANDGMLHGFNSLTGAEVFAYIPGVRDIYKNLPNLSKTNYTHNFFVNGAPIEADVFLNGAWKTILAGHLRKGGQGVYALNITNPNDFVESKANQLYLWEFTDENDPDLGYVYGNVTVAKVRTGSNTSKWAIIFGNGYNNSQADGFASTTGKAALFILFIEQGIGGNWIADTDYIKIPVGSSNVNTPNGLAQPYAVDIDDDYIVDYVYAGDLLGNLWKFDLRDTVPINWKNKASILFTASQSTPGDQPITAPVIVGAHPTGLQNGVMVYFGTGRYLEPTDHSNVSQTTQSFYGIWDKLNNTTVSKTALLKQEILSEVTPPSGASLYRAVSSNPISWDLPNQHLGWFLDLKLVGSSSNLGERQITQPILRNSNIIFTTLIPNPDLCGYGGESWLMEINAATGGGPTPSPFDINNDGMFTSADYLDVLVNGNNQKFAAAGVKSASGITATPSILVSQDRKSETKVLSGSQGLSTVQENPALGPLGRQNWRQLY